MISKIANQPQSPLYMYHGNSRAYGRPNTVDTINIALEQKIDIIEIDVRKSKEGILYCYHGGVFAWILSYLPMRIINTLINVDPLEKVLLIVPKKYIVFLDIKDRHITPEDIKHIRKKYKLTYWIASYKLSYLHKIKLQLPDCMYIYNFGFLFFKRGVKQAHNLSIDAIKIFRWQCKEKNLIYLKKYGIRYTIHELFFSKKQLKKAVFQYGSLWVVTEK